MDENNNCTTCGLYVSSLDDFCPGCNMRTKYYKEQKKEIPTLLLSGSFALLLLITGIIRSSLS